MEDPRYFLSALGDVFGISQFLNAVANNESSTLFDGWLASRLLNGTPLSSYYHLGTRCPTIFKLEHFKLVAEILGVELDKYSYLPKVGKQLLVSNWRLERSVIDVHKVFSVRASFPVNAVYVMCEIGKKYYLGVRKLDGVVDWLYSDGPFGLILGLPKEGSDIFFLAILERDSTDWASYHARLPLSLPGGYNLYCNYCSPLPTSYAGSEEFVTPTLCTPMYETVMCVHAKYGKDIATIVLSAMGAEEVPGICVNSQYFTLPNLTFAGRIRLPRCRRIDFVGPMNLLRPRVQPAIRNCAMPLVSAKWVRLGICLYKWSKLSERLDISVEEKPINAKSWNDIHKLRDFFGTGEYIDDGVGLNYEDFTSDEDVSEDDDDGFPLYG